MTSNVNWYYARSDGPPWVFMGLLNTYISHMALSLYLIIDIHFILVNREIKSQARLWMLLELLWVCPCILVKSTILHCFHKVFDLWKLLWCVIVLINIQITAEWFHLLILMFISILHLLIFASLLLVVVQAWGTWVLYVDEEVHLTHLEVWVGEL